MICGDGLSTFKFIDTQKYTTLRKEMVRMPMLIRLHLSRCDRRYSMRFSFVVNLNSTRSIFVCWPLAEFGSFIVVVDADAVEHFLGDVVCNSNGFVALSSLASSFSLSLCNTLERLIFSDHFSSTFSFICSCSHLVSRVFFLVSCLFACLFAFFFRQPFRSLLAFHWICSFFEPEDDDHATHYYSVITLKWEKKKKPIN